MLKLTYSRRTDDHATVTVLGDAAGIRDLYWQLTANYKERPDGAGIGKITITNLEGTVLTPHTVMTTPFIYDTNLSRLDN